jgi:hypothetical protein
LKNTEKSEGRKKPTYSLHLPLTTDKVKRSYKSKLFFRTHCSQMVCFMANDAAEARGDEGILKGNGFGWERVEC